MNNDGYISIVIMEYGVVLQEETAEICKTESKTESNNFLYVVNLSTH